MLFIDIVQRLYINHRPFSEKYGTVDVNSNLNIKCLRMCALVLVFLSQRKRKYCHDERENTRVF